MHKLFDETSDYGVWWDPLFPEEHVHGTITFSPNDEILLQLNGILGPAKSHSQINRDKPYTPEVIQGTTFKGESVTLLHNYEIKTNFSSASLSTQEIICDYMLRGIHVQSKSELNFSELHMGFTSLEEWFWGGFPIRAKQNQTTQDTFTVQHYPPDELNVRLDSLQAFFKTYSTISAPSWACREYTLINQMHWMLKPDAPQSFTWSLEILHSFKRFLTLCTGEPVYPVHLVGVPTVENTEDEHKYSCSILFVQKTHYRRKSKRPDEMLLYGSDIKEELGIILDRWFKESENLHSVLDLFFSYIYKPDVYVETSFLSLTRALESFHRATHDGAYLEKVEYEKCREIMTEAIPHNIPSDLRTALKSRLLYGNEYSLRKKLTELLRELPEPLLELVTSDVKYFVGKVVDTRNFLTHYDETIKEKTLLNDPRKMSETIRSLRALLIILLLDKLQVKFPVIMTSIQRFQSIPMW